MANPKFTKDGYDDLELDGYVAYPLRSPREKIQVMERTAGGSIQVEDLGVELRSLPLNLQLLDATTKNALDTWWDTVADGAVNTFTYTDPDGTEFTVRMMTSPYDLPEVSPGRWSGTITLEVDS